MSTRSCNLAVCFLAFAVATVAPPAMAGQQIRLEAVLVGTDAEPAAFGRARFDLEKERTRFEVRIEGVFGFDAIFVVVGDQFVGTIVMDTEQGRGELRLDTDLGDEIPVLRAGEFVILIGDDGTSFVAFGELLES
jgi:hypothetical protein